MSGVVMATRAISKQGNVLQSNKASTNEGIHLGKFNFQLDVIFCNVACCLLTLALPWQM